VRLIWTLRSGSPTSQKYRRASLAAVSIPSLPPEPKTVAQPDRTLPMPDHHPQPQPADEQQPIAPEHHERLHEILHELATLGYCLPGSVAERQIRCPNPGCHCHRDPPQLHGPYLAWTRKVNKKTVTRNLTPQAGHPLPRLVREQQAPAPAHLRASSALPQSRR
jgi:hypothetical protein